MGKPYQSELAALPATLAWAMAQDIRPLTGFLRESAGQPLLATGSGGSLSAAKLAAAFHQESGAGLGKSVTPLELVAQRGVHATAAHLLLSAGGANTDILGAFRHLVRHELGRVAILTARGDSSLGKLAKRFPSTVCQELEPPSGRDGFLATNSLVTFSVVLARAYISAFETSDASLGAIGHLAGHAHRWASHAATLSEQAEALWSRDDLVVLYPPEAEAGATDLESKFTEAALGSVHIADYRHFAHGRHHWLAKRGADSAVLAFVTPRFRSLADSTLACLPKGIPTMRVELPPNPFEAGTLSVLAAIILAGCAGRERGIDPGRPGVPEFGRKIYHLRWRPPPVGQAAPAGLETAAIARKQRATSLNSEPQAVPRTAFRQFCARLRRQRLKAVVFDYDGTMVSTAGRFDPLPDEIVKPLVSLLRDNIVVGVASGRGKSLREALRQALPSELWPRVVVGYYNGSQTGLLTERALPVVGSIQPELLTLRKKLEGIGRLKGQIVVEARPNQLSVCPKPGLHVDDLWRQVMESCSRNKTGNFNVVRSGHSVDILAAGVSKLAVVERVRALAGAEAEEVLRIGDQGGWPGNDHDLLADFPALSVDEVSMSLDSCWNLAPRGCFGPAALCAYLDALRPNKGTFRLELARLEKGWR